jgi:TonB family protein
MKRLFFVFGGLFFGLMACSINTFAQENNPQTVNAGIVNGKAISLPKPEYPIEARKANIGGRVAVQVVIDEEGNVISANAVSGNQSVNKDDGKETLVEAEETVERKLLYEASENAARQARFSPTLLEGKPVKVKGIIVYNFVSDTDSTAVNGGVLNGKAVSLPLPQYPEPAKTVNAGGAVNVLIVIDEEGNVTSAKAVSGHPLLRESAVQAAKNAKFSPTFLSGKAIKVTGVLVYNFTP